MKQKVIDALKSLPDDFVVLTIVPSMHFEEVNMQLLAVLTESGKGTYVTMNKPYQTLVSRLSSSNILMNNLHFIDCVTRNLEPITKDEDNCLFIASPRDLTSLGIALDKIFKNAQHEFIFLDSLDTLTTYNDPNKVIRFMHFLTGKIRIHKLKGVIISVHEDTDKGLVSELAQFCDKVLDLTK